MVLSIEPRVSRMLGYCSPNELPSAGPDVIPSIFSFSLKNYFTLNYVYVLLCVGVCM